MFFPSLTNYEEISSFFLEIEDEILEDLVELYVLPYDKKILQVWSLGMWGILNNFHQMESSHFFNYLVGGDALQE